MMPASFWFWVCTSGCLLFAEPQRPADAIYYNGRIHQTTTGTDVVKALAIREGRILATGTNEAILPLAGTNTETIDLAGATVLPGFYDSHVHWLGGGLQLSRVDLRDAPNEATFGQRIRAAAAELPRDRWLLGGNWDHELTFQGVLPTASLLDQFTGDRPAYLTRYDAHMALANTAALKLAGITAATPDPAGGVIERGPDGKTPTGILKDNAMQLVEDRLPEASDEEIFAAIRAAQQEAAARGVTSVQDMEGSPSLVRKRYLQILKRMEARGELTCRVAVRFPIAVQHEIAEQKIQASPFVEVGGVKGYMDGSLGSNTARMKDLYLNRPTRGVFVTEPERMMAFILRADQAKYSVAIHAIGDEANQVLLDAFVRVGEIHGLRDRRLRIEHAQHLRPEDLPRFGKLGVVASMQPFHVVDDARWAEGRIGAERCRTSYAFRTLLDQGATLAFGSDWPVVPLNPWLGVDAAVNRRPTDGKFPQGWYPEQKITVAEALTAFTRGSAYAGFHELDRGHLKPGAVADFVVVDQNVFDNAAKLRLGETKTRRTVSAGRTVFQSP